MNLYVFINTLCVQNHPAKVFAMFYSRYQELGFHSTGGLVNGP